jgi:hypothetical protein
MTPITVNITNLTLGSDWQTPYQSTRELFGEHGGEDAREKRRHRGQHDAQRHGVAVQVEFGKQNILKPVFVT